MQAIGASFWRPRRLPVLLQTEAAECGLACLAMIASFWGHKIDLAGMRRRFSISLKGLTLKNLMVMARAMSLQPRALKLDLNQLAQLKLPCILHWDLNHFVVLSSLSAKSATIIDPSVGTRRLKLHEFGNHFTGVALELLPTSTFVRANERVDYPLLALVGRVVGLKKGVFQLIALGLALQVCVLVGPFYLQWIVDEALLAGDKDLVSILGFGFLLLALVQTAISGIRSWITTIVSTEMNFQWLGNVFSHLLRLPLQYFERRHTGDVVSRFSSIQTIQQSVTTQFVEGVIDGILAICTIVMMFLYSPQLAVIAAVAVAIYVVLRWFLYWGLRAATSEQIIHEAKQQTHFLESIRGIQSLRIFGRSNDRHASWLNLLADQFNAEMRIARLSVLYRTANFFLFNVERVLIIWIAALATLRNEFSVGMLFAFVSYKDQFSQRMTGLIDKAFDLRMLRLHGERLADIVFADPEPDAQACELNVEEIVPSIEVVNLSFRYSDSEPLVLKNFSLKIPPGQCVAITGASGCGKTTLVKILLGLLTPTEGDVLVGDQKLEELGLENYRKMVGTVMQEDCLFAGSISENICFFDQAPDHARIQRCAILAAVHAEILAMPMTYNTLVGDIGSGLSGGQKQRILLARALYREPRILIMDEATSHLDIWNEQAVSTAIKQLRLTRVIVAHRPETVAMADRVVLLHEGKVVDEVMQLASEEREVV